MGTMVHIVDIPYRIPAGIAYVWGLDGDVAEDHLRMAGKSQGAIVLGPNLLAFLPSAGNAEVIEAAIVAMRRLLARSSGQSEEAEGTFRSGQLCGLIFPGSIEYRQDTPRLVSDGLLDDLRKAPPRLVAGRVYLTGHATRELETPWQLGNAPSYTGPSGRSRTLWVARGVNAGGQHSRNPKVLRQRSNWIANPSLEETSQAIAQHPVVRIVGEMGVGKSRLAAEALGEHSQVWARCWSTGSSGPSLATQIARQLQHARDWPRPTLPRGLEPRILTGWQRALPKKESEKIQHAVIESLSQGEQTKNRFLVLDELHRADAHDRSTIELVKPLAAIPNLQVLLLSRPASWLDDLDVPCVKVGDLDDAGKEQLSRNLTNGLSFPPAMLERFTEACKGNPFAFEEGLHNLVRRRLLRENYGNFFFAGPKDTNYLPTARLDRHLLSEALRVDGLEVCFRLASANGPTPKELLALSSDTEDEVLKRLCDIGLLVQDEVDGRLFLDFTRPAFRFGFRQCVEDHVVQRMRGELLEPTIGGGSARQAWSTYQQLAGTPKATEALLEVLALPKAERPKEGLFKALHRELIAHRDRDGGTSTEFELLWEYLPLARKFAVPETLIPQIERALEICKPGEPRRMALLALHSEEALIQGELDSAERRAVEGLDLARREDPRRQSILLLQLGKVLQRQDRHPEAKKLLLDLLRSMDPKTNPSQSATCHYHLGNIYLREQDFELALEHHQTALKRRREQGLPTGLGHSLTALAALNAAVGNYSQSLELYQEALEVLAGAPDPSERAFPLVGLGRILSRLGDFAGASAPLREALELRKRRFDKVGVEISKLSLAQNDLDLGVIDRALQESRLALFRLTMIGARKYRADAESLIGQLLLRQGKPDDALERLEDAAHLHRQVGAEVDSLFDEAHAVESCIVLQQAEGVELRCQILAERLATAPYPELGERLDLRLYQGWKALANMGEKSGDEKVPLERAYRELCRKTALLEPELRNRFLLQVPTNRSIMQFAQDEGLADVSRLQELMARKLSEDP